VPTIPDTLARTTVELYGPSGVEWLRRLPALLAEYGARWLGTTGDQWSTAIGPPFEPLSYNYVAPAVRADGTPAVLKLGVPNPELRTEIEALRIFDGRGAVRLLAADPEGGALLLERLSPGEPLATLLRDERAAASDERALASDARATSIAARLMSQLWRPAPTDGPFPTVARWAAGLQRLRGHFGGGTGPFPANLIEKAEALFAQLIDSMAPPVLLHGDLHHHNILSAGRQPWLALDPKGVLGEPAYEAGAFLRNPLPWLLDQPDPRRILSRRLDQLAGDLGLDRARLLGWGLAQAVLSAWWSFEDHGHGWHDALTCAELLATLE
jgi:streptomycin 6-kinase